MTYFNFIFCFVKEGALPNLNLKSVREVGGPYFVQKAKVWVVQFVPGIFKKSSLTPP